jgi:hypothetical protein
MFAGKITTTNKSEKKLKKVVDAEYVVWYVIGVVRKKQ